MWRAMTTAYLQGLDPTESCSTRPFTGCVVHMVLCGCSRFHIRPEIVKWFSILSNSHLVFGCHCLRYSLPDPIPSWVYSWRTSSRGSQRTSVEGRPSVGLSSTCVWLSPSSHSSSLKTLTYVVKIPTTQIPIFFSSTQNIKCEDH